MREKIRNKTLDDVWGRKKNETNRKDSQNTSLILRTETFTLSEMMMTSRHTQTHTHTMPLFLPLQSEGSMGLYEL